ncbi:MAG: hypothetical protein AUG09_02115 [Acidobacteria bacterium 13_1_20CM_2_68_7]|nr:MAG: hypothetical protein AUG09_02115 [Acidobacteria bacterium 13_1_20CM_2_68_7]
MPKPFLSLDGGASLFRRTYQRIVPLVGRSRILVVTAASDVPWVRKQAPEIPSRQILAEEIGRDTATAVALAAHWLRSRYGDAIMVVLPADHSIRPAMVFRSALRFAIRAVRKTGGLVTIGVPPRAPETGLGYIRPSAREVISWRVPAAVLRRIPRAPIDRAVLERSREVLVIRAPFDWSDVGNWDALGGVLRRDARRNEAIGRMVALDASRCLGVNGGGLTVFIGLRDVVSVRSGDVVLVCHRTAVQRVREVVRRLRGSLSAYR